MGRQCVISDLAVVKVTAMFSVSASAASINTEACKVAKTGCFLLMSVCLTLAELMTAQNNMG